MTLLAIVALGAGLACPVHMLWRMRRGRRGCCEPVAAHATGLQARQARLAQDLARLAATRK